MAFNGSGTFNRIYNWVNDKANGIKITASRMDGEFDGIATGLSSCITKDGQTTITSNIPFSNYKITGIGAGTARTDVINVGQVQDNQFLYWGTTGGSADAYTLTPSPTITAYATTQQFTAKISATNTTTTPYLQISGIANPTTTAVIKKLDASKAETAVEASDLLIDGIYHFQRNSANDAWIVLNPEKPYINLTNGTGYNVSATTTTQGIVELLTDAEMQAGTDTTRVSTASNIASLFGASSQTSGYARLPIKVSGAFQEVIIQWGTSSSLGGGAVGTITLPLTFPNSGLFATTIGTTYTGSAESNNAVQSLTTTTLTIRTGSTTSQPYRWVAIGY